MDDYSELEINLVSLDSAQCQVQIRYRPSGTQSEMRLGALNNSLVFQPLITGLDNLGDKDWETDEYAHALTTALFSNPTMAQSFSDALTAAAISNSVLRIRLWIDASTSPLHNICWELLLNPKDNTRLSNGERILFSRGLSTLAANHPTLKPPEDATALLVVSNPDDLTAHKMVPINIDAELERARSNLGELGAIRLLPNGKGLRATFNNLFAMLTPDVDILYLVCHGTIANGDGRLWLEGLDGKTEYIAATDFVARMRGLSVYPKLVVLISCQSAGGKSGPVWRALGPRLVNAGIPVVLAMQGNFSMQSESIFVPRFFQSLWKHGEVDRALSYARAFIADRPDWWMPALFSHLRDNRIFGQSNPNRLAFINVQSYEPETVYIPSGSFWMGSNSGDGVPSHETPQHEVFLPAYRIGKYPVTNAQYEVFVREKGIQVMPGMGWNGRVVSTGGENYPMTGVTWYQALEYCRWLSEKTGRNYSLPNEAQWEKACRGSDKRKYPWGDEFDGKRCNDGSSMVAEVNAYPVQSESGCFDLVGNILQWTCSLWGEKRAAPDPKYTYPWKNDTRNDLNINRQIRRVVRGSAIKDNLDFLRCSARRGQFPDDAGLPGERVGFRVVMEI